MLKTLVKRCICTVVVLATVAPHCDNGFAVIFAYGQMWLDSMHASRTSNSDTTHIRTLQANSLQDIDECEYNHPVTGYPSLYESLSLNTGCNGQQTSGPDTCEGTVTASGGPTLPYPVYTVASSNFGLGIGLISQRGGELAATGIQASRANRVIGYEVPTTHLPPGGYVHLGFGANRGLNPDLYADENATRTTSGSLDGTLLEEDPRTIILNSPLQEERTGTREALTFSPTNSHGDGAKDNKDYDVFDGVPWSSNATSPTDEGSRHTLLVPPDTTVGIIDSPPITFGDLSPQEPVLVLSTDDHFVRDQVIPEPSACLIFGMFALGLVACARRRSFKGSNRQS